MIRRAGVIAASRRLITVAPGTIIWLWTSSIPSGWFLCDGNNGTPNLVGRFVRGASSPGGTGGGSHRHSINTTGSHNHGGTDSDGHHRHNGVTSPTGTTGFSDVSGTTTTEEGGHTHTLTSAGSHNHGGNSGSATSEPPFYSLVPIMKG